MSLLTRTEAVLVAAVSGGNRPHDADRRRRPAAWPSPHRLAAFSLTIAVSITLQTLPAVVSTWPAAGIRALAKRKVLVKRPTCIEGLGGVDVLVTDKTGTLTEGRINFTAALPATTGISGHWLSTPGRSARRQTTPTEQSSF